MMNANSKDWTVRNYSPSSLGATTSCGQYMWYWVSWINGTFMSGLGQVIGQNVRMVYYDSSPYTIRAMGISSSTDAPSYWIIPGCYYDPG
jgi:hypothetical protein